LYFLKLYLFHHTVAGNEVYVGYLRDSVTQIISAASFANETPVAILIPPAMRAPSTLIAPTVIFDNNDATRNLDSCKWIAENTAAIFT